MPLTPSLARQIVEVLGSSGTPPAKGVQYFNAGNQSLLEALDQFYFSSYLQDGGAAYKMVIGDYGSGKSHFLYCLRDLAWERGFAVSKVDLSPVETPYNDQRAVYAAVARNLIWHEADEAAATNTACRAFWRARCSASWAGRSAWRRPAIPTTARWWTRWSWPRWTAWPSRTRCWPGSMR